LSCLRRGPRARKKARGQAVVITALAMITLIAFMGLATDVGVMYMQRRQAQNSSDAAALAAAQVMLENYEYYLDGGDGDDTIDTAINDAITAYAGLHNVSRGDLQAYYVNDSKQIVSATEIGSLGSVPWESMGVKGVIVKNYSGTSSFFMSIFGWNTVGATATSVGFMGVAADSGNGLPVFPVGFFTDPYGLSDMVIGRTYTILDGKTQDGADDQWAYPDFNGHGDISNSSGAGQVGHAWWDCGFNPRVLTDRSWNEWAAANCADQVGIPNTWGPVQHYMCADSDCTSPQSTPISVPYLKWGPDDHGWWLGGTTGSISTGCSTLATLMNMDNGTQIYVPIIDTHTGSPGDTNSRFHLLAVAKLELQNSYVDCDIPPDACPCPPGIPVAHSEWHIEAIFRQMYLAGSTGSHAAINRWSEHTVFLDN